MNVCVFGASSEYIESSYLQAAHTLGRLIGQKKWTLVFGAGSTGIMGECAKGALEEGGHTIGVSPVFFQTMGVLSDELATLELTETMSERKARVEELADAFIVCPGGIGTFEEFLEVLTLRQLGQMYKPICVLDTNGYYQDLITMLKQAVTKKFMSQETLDLFKVVQTPQEAVDYIANAPRDHHDVDLMVHATMVHPHNS